MTLQLKNIRRNARSIDPDTVDQTPYFGVSDRQQGLSRRSQALMAAAGMDAPARRWFVVTVDAGMDRKVMETLVFANVECWMPHVLEKPVRRSGRKCEERPVTMRLVTPGYVFVRVTATIDAWSGLSSIRGAAGVLGMAGTPLAARDTDVSLFRRYLAGDTAAADIVLGRIKAGDRASLKNGPFQSFSGLVSEVDAGRGFALVEILMFGRATPVTVGIDQLQKM